MPSEALAFGEAGHPGLDVRQRRPLQTEVKEALDRDPRRDVADAEIVSGEPARAGKVRFDQLELAYDFVACSLGRAGGALTHRKRSNCITKVCIAGSKP